MKKFFLKSLMFIVVMTFMSLTFNSCEPEDNRPDCEKNNTGTFVIINNSPYAMAVSIADDGGWFDDRIIYAWGSTTFSNVEAGGVTVAECDDATGCAVWDSYVDQCETTEFTITINKKSTDGKDVTSNQEFSENTIVEKYMMVK